MLGTNVSTTDLQRNIRHHHQIKVVVTIFACSRGQIILCVVSWNANALMGWTNLNEVSQEH